MDYFQSTNVLTQEDYSLLMQAKEPFYSERGPGCIIINADGHTSTVKTDLKGLPTDQHSIFNFTMDIEKYSIKYPPIFLKLLYNIKNCFENNGVLNAKPYLCRTYRSNKTINWHKHAILKNVKPKNWYCCIYYMHENWDVKYKGALRVSKSEKLLGEKFDCLSNSFVTHNGFYGHSVDELIKGYEGNRDIFLTQWVIDSQNN